MLTTKDYIADPKPNGYRSLHLIVEVPVFLSRQVEHVPVELQIRTIAMDFWATMEHKLHYKYQADLPPDLAAEIDDAARVAADLDARMGRLRDQSPTARATRPARPAPAPKAPRSRAPPPEAPEADLDGVPDVVAEVNGKEIGREEFVSSFEGQLQQAAMSQQGGGEVDQDALKKQVADQLVSNRLLTQAASEAGIEPTEKDVQTTLEDIAAQNGLESADAVISALGEQGISEDQVRADAATQFQVTSYIEAEADVEEPSEKELREQYDTLVEQMEAQGGDGASAPEVPPFEDVRDQIAQQATSQQQSAAVDKIVTDLREKGDVTINL